MFLWLIKSAFSNDGKKSAFYAAYTVLFLTMAIACFSWFIVLGYSFIYEGDGWHQHFVALVYYAKYLKGIIHNLIIEHKLIIPDWDFYIGEGADIVNVFHYYVIGDPLTLLSVFVPNRYMQYFYSVLSVFRLYLAGLSFSALCFGTGIKNRFAIVTGAIAYSFSCWAICCVANHPYFICPMIYFPLMILGIEKIIRGERPYLFILSAAVSAASNFYFFYIIAMLAIIYTIIRLAFLYRGNVKDGIYTLLHLGVMAVIGTCIAGIIMFPVLMVFLNDSRLSVKQSFEWFYSRAYYSQLPAIFVSYSQLHWLFMGFSAPVIIAIFLLFAKRKNNNLLKVLFILGVLIIIFPIGGRLLNGMSYKANRWSWAFALLSAFILVKMWDDLRTLTSKEWKILMGASIALYLMCNFSGKSRTVNTFTAIPMLFITLIVIRKNPSDEMKSIRQQILLFILVAAGAFNSAYSLYSPNALSYVTSCKENKLVWREWNRNEAAALKKEIGSEYSRITGSWLTSNANILNEISSTQYYWSNSNPFMNRFRTDMYIKEPQFFNYLGYDDRTSLLALSAVQYYMADKSIKNRIPKGYSLFKDYPEYSVYKNDLALPIAYCYDEYITKADWDLLNVAQKQEVQMDVAVIEADTADISEVQRKYPDYIIPYDLECVGSDITQTENGLTATKAYMQAVLNLQREIKGEEIYVAIEGLEFVPNRQYDLYFGDESVDPLNLYDRVEFKKLAKKDQLDVWKYKKYWDPIQNANIIVESSDKMQSMIDYLQPESTFSGGRHDFIVNLGCPDEPVSKITITLPGTGCYTYKSLRVYSIPTDQYQSKIEKLRENTLQNIEFDTDTVRGSISLEEPKLLCLAMPYSKGWKAFIDNEQTEVLNVNERYMGILIPAGTHNIRFNYSMPYKKAGAVLTLIGILVFIVIIVRYERKSVEN